jgi:hypothetical protein
VNAIRDAQIVHVGGRNLQRLGADVGRQDGALWQIQGEAGSKDATAGPHVGKPQARLIQTDSCCHVKAPADEELRFWAWDERPAVHSEVETVECAMSDDVRHRLVSAPPPNESVE